MKPFYIQGVAYNPTHDWRDGFLPLDTQTTGERILAKSKAMGANTIRRYGNSGDIRLEYPRSSWLQRWI